MAETDDIARGTDPECSSSQPVRGKDPIDERPTKHRIGESEDIEKLKRKKLKLEIEYLELRNVNMTLQNKKLELEIDKMTGVYVVEVDPTYE